MNNMKSRKTRRPRNKSNGPITSAYPDEREKINSDFEEQLSVWIKIQDALDYHGYDIDAVLVDGLPELALIKR